MCPYDSPHKQPIKLFVESRLKIVDGIKYYAQDRNEIKLLPKVHKRFEKILKEAVPSVAAGLPDRERKTWPREDALGENENTSKVKILRAVPEQKPTKERVHNPTTILGPPQNTIASKGIFTESKGGDFTRDMDSSKPGGEAAVAVPQQIWVKERTKVTEVV